MANRRDLEERRRLFDGLRWLLDIIVVIAIAVFLTVYMGEKIAISGYSMDPVLTHNEEVLIDKISYHFKDPERFDIIVIQTKDARSIVKRIIGLPGERILIKDGIVYINGVPMEEDKEKGKILNAGLAEEEILLGSEEYFVLGDNRNNSEDSRQTTIGNIKKTAIVGKVWLRVTTLDAVGLIK